MANRRLARWYDILTEYQPMFLYPPGAKKGIADALSRRRDLQPETKFFHDLSVTSFNDTSFSLAISEVTIDTDLITNIKKAYVKDRDAHAFFYCNQATNRELECESHIQAPQEVPLLSHSQWIALVSIFIKRRTAS
ncbi:hypothetical protein PC120_g22334 [Phytophthora cactorum]|nr:hypothetical protein PC120_g22334 [Phytophthora cactorum]